MRRRDILRKTASASAVVMGMSSITGASETGPTLADDVSEADIEEADEYAVVAEDGERVLKPRAQVEDVESLDHCHTTCCENCPNLADKCNLCVCSTYCYL